PGGCSGGSSGARSPHRSPAARRSRSGTSVAGTAKIITRRSPTRCGPCNRPSTSQAQPAGQGQLAYTLGGRILAAASRGRLVCGSSNDPRGYFISSDPSRLPLRAELLVTCLARTASQLVVGDHG